MTDTRFTPCGQYEVTSDGRIFSIGTNWRGYGRREMRQQLNASGYPSVRIIQDGKRKRLAVHRLVALAFHGSEPSPKHEVRHLDGNPQNNHKDNLMWGTKSENAKDRSRHGRNHKLPWDDPEFREKQIALIQAGMDKWKAEGSKRNA